MSVIRSESADGNTVTIRLGDRFGFQEHADFRASFREDPSGSRSYVVDMRAVSYLDSAALGMLLVLREHAGEDQRAVCLQVGSDPVSEILGLANFDSLFDIERA